MPNANIDTIIDFLACVTINSTQTDDYQDDVIYEIARGAYPGVVGPAGAAYIAVTGGTARYALPTTSNARTPLALCYDDSHLMHLRKDEAWAADNDWRDSPESVVVGYLQDPEDRHYFALVPPPKLSGETVGAATPFNGTWVEGNITAIYAEADTAFAGTTYNDLKLPVALEALARELARDSDHQDRMAASVAHNLAEFFFLMFNPVGAST